MVKAKRILSDSIKDRLIPYVSELKTPKEMFEALTRLYESKNTSRKLLLRHQLRNVMMDKLETLSTYFTRASQIKDQLASIGDPVVEKELVLTTLNGFPSSWDVFVQGRSYPSLIGHGHIVLKKRKFDIQHEKDK